MKHDDGILEFREDNYYVGPCVNCGEDTLVWRIKDIKLPDGIKPSHKLIVFQASTYDPGYVPIRQIGIGCGCYAKFHRQIAHIKDRQKG